MKEFKDFALKGNVVDLAIGVIIGAAFSSIVSSLVDDVITTGATIEACALILLKVPEVKVSVATMACTIH